MFTNVIITARSKLRQVLFLAVCVFLFVYEIFLEPLNEFTTNSHGRRVLSLARMSLKVKVKGQKSRLPETKNGIFGPFGSLREVYVLLVRETSLASIVRAAFVTRNYYQQWCSYGGQAVQWNRVLGMIIVDMTNTCAQYLKTVPSAVSKK